MIHLVQNALDLSAEHVEGGLCSNATKVLDRVNEAQRRLLQSGDYAHMVDQVRICTQNDSITLPREHIAVRLVNMNGTPVLLESQAYEFLEAGPGEYTWDQCQKLADAGTHPAFFDLPTDQTVRLWAASTSVDDSTLSITFRGRTSTGSEILTDAGSPLQTLIINSWDSGVEGTTSADIGNYSTMDVHKLVSVHLPAGLKGYVSLYAYDTVSKSMWFLSRYHPAEVTPGYRRYRLPRSCEDGLMVHCLAKKQYIPATLGTDILLVQNLDAVKQMVMGIERENAGDVNGAMAYKQMALGNLAVQNVNEHKDERFTINMVGVHDCMNIGLR